MAINKFQNVQVRSGNTMRVLLGGKEVGLLQSVRASDDYAPDVASGIGDIHAIEYVPTMARHSLSVSAMVLYRESLRDAGVSVENGDDALRGLVFTFEIYDKRDPGKLLRKYEKVSFASGDIEVSKHQIIATNAQFNAIDVVGTGL